MLFVLCGTAWPGYAESDTVTFDRIPGATFRFTGVLGQRVDANVTSWLLPAPAANPGMLEMFRLRDRQPVPKLVPWAGEFVGKYLISAVQAMSMTEDPRLPTTVRQVVDQLIASQAEDGYLGPFPKRIRLLANWDLWGHYHCMLALLMWQERTGDQRALQACRAAADLVCRTFLDGKRRALDAGSTEMNLAVIHVLGRLYRQTKEPRYLRMMRAIERDWQQAGDYLRTGLAGVEFFETPKPRWESLHDLQGLVELFRITGDDRYRRAFLHHWYSIHRWDQRNTGGFSSGEKATGNPFAPTAIETCCSIAWTALSIDALRLTGDAQIADALELATYNAVAGAQHFSGRWWTYDTPMDGVRKASAHSIVFQARAGTPELNCCSVNGPRGLGMLSEWAVMQTPDGLAINAYEPGTVALTLADGKKLRVETASKYPLEGQIALTIVPEQPAELVLRLRVPAWASLATVRVNRQPIPDVKPGTYCEIQRTWAAGDRVELAIPLALRVGAGDNEAYGRVSIYRGPLLLAYDQRYNSFDDEALGQVDLARLSQAKPVASQASSPPSLRPWLLVDVPLTEGKTVRLCDFASAGACGSHYRSWLAATKVPPPAPVPWMPADGARVPRGRMLFTWRRPAIGAIKSRTHEVQISRSADFQRPVLQSGRHPGDQAILESDQTGSLVPGQRHYWRVVARNTAGETVSLGPAKSFIVDPSLPPLSDADLTRYGEGPDRVLVQAPLKGNANPKYGRLLATAGMKPASGPGGVPASAIALDGKVGKVLYGVRRFPERDYSAALWVAVAPGRTRLGQIFSAWTASMDDPLRLCVQNHKLYARIEAGSAYSTKDVPLEPDRWTHVAAVKNGSRLTLYVDGKAITETAVPAEIYSRAADFALGANPHYRGDEFLPVRLAAFRFYARALSADEIRSLAVIESAR